MNVTKLNVPYFSQLNNLRNPYGSCNVTAIAMCLAYFGVKSNNPQQQLEDELYEYMTDHGLDRHVPEDLATVVHRYGHKDNFSRTANIQEAIAHLQAGSPCVIHGWFTDSGHIVTVVGCDDKGLYVHDPYGEYFRHGYDNSVSGCNLHYSYGLIRRLCMDDGFLWLHRISA